MGGGKWSDDVYKSISSSYDGKSSDEIFESRDMITDMDPRNLSVREARDSDEHPETLPIIVMLDVTGSMGRIPHKLVAEKLQALMGTLLKNGIKHPQILFGAIGDQYSDKAPLQVGQFESETELLNKWLTSIFLEGWGGGTAEESYPLAWMFAARYTSLDHYEKRNQKGFLFTIGDEKFHETVTKADIKTIFDRDGQTVKAEELYEEVSQMYNTFHIYVEDGSYSADRIMPVWTKLMGQNALVLEHSDNIAELIATVVTSLEGAKLDEVMSGFDDKTKTMVGKTVASLKDAPKVLTM